LFRTQETKTDYRMWFSAHGSVVAEAQGYKPEGRGFITWWGSWILSIYLILPAVPGPGIYPASKRNDYQKEKWKKKFLGSRHKRCVRLTTSTWLH
jgi:hypothetical protein